MVIKIGIFGMMSALTLDSLTSSISNGKKLREHVREKWLLRQKSDKAAEENRKEVEWAEIAVKLQVS